MDNPETILGTGHRMKINKTKKMSNTDSKYGFPWNSKYSNYIF